MNGNHREGSEDRVTGRIGDPSCEEVREARLTAYALGQLSAEEQADVETELAASPPARQAVEDIRALADQIQQSSRATIVAPSPDLRIAVESWLRQPRAQWLSHRSGPLDAPPLPADRARRTWRTWAALASAVCLLGAAVGLYFGQRDRTPAVMPDQLVAGQPRPGPLPGESHRPMEGAPSAGAIADAHQVAAKPPLPGAEVNTGGWRAHTGAFTLSVVEKMQPIAPEPGPQLVTKDPLPVPAKLDSPKSESQDSLPKADTLAGPRRPTPRWLARNTRHQPAANPGFFGPPASAGPVLARVAPEVPAPPLAKKPREPKDAGAVGPKPFGAHMGASRSPETGSDGAPPEGKANGSKYASPSETHLAVPAGMRPDRGAPPAVAKNSKKGKGPAPAPPSVPEDPPPGVVVENEFLRAAKYPYSAFSLEVDRSTYGDIDRFLRAGRLPWPDRVQVEDLVNYFQYDDPQPAGERPFAISVEGAACPWDRDHRLVRIAIVARDASASGAGRGRAGQGRAAPLVANDVCVQLQFLPALVESYRLIGYDGPSPGQEPDVNLPKGVSLAAGDAVTALYEIVRAKPAKPAAGDVRPAKAQRTSARDLTAIDTVSPSLIVRLRYERPRTEEYRLLEAAWIDSEQPFDAASRDFRFAAAVAAFGMTLRGSFYCGDMTLEAIERIADSSRGEDPFGQRAGFVDLVRIARKLKADR